MSKPVVVSWSGAESSWSLRSLNRAALYGRRKRLALDAAGNPCSRASLLDDGSLLLRSGMTGQGYFLADGHMFKVGELTGLAEDGSPLPVAPGTLGVAQELTGPVDPSMLLDLRVSAVYVLAPETVDAQLQQRLDDGQMFSFGFNFRDDYHEETAILLANKDGVFALVGNPVSRQWSSLEISTSLPVSDDESDDDLDFEMF